MIPQTAPESQLQQADSILRLGRNGSVIFGSALAGLVIARRARLRRSRSTPRRSWSQRG